MAAITAQCALVNRVSARQHHLVTRSDLLERGITRNQIEAWEHSGFLAHVETGVFLVAGGRLDWVTRLLAVCLSSGGIASHRSAAALHGIDGGNRGWPEITIPDGDSFRRGGIRVHESRDLQLVTPVVQDGVPTTPVARTVLDLGAVNKFAVPDAARDAVGKGLTTWSELFSTLVRHSRKGRRGCGPLRAVLDGYYGDKTESQLERKFLRLVQAAGLPPMDQQLEVRDEDGFIMRLDFAYADLFIAIEIDSALHHHTVEAFEADRVKRNRLARAGWLLLAFTSDRIGRHPVAVCEEIAAARRQRQAFFRRSDLQDKSQ